jgi:hypothetical protein
MNRPAFVVFALLQFTTQVCSWIWPIKSLSHISAPLWAISFYLAIPGNLVSGYLISRYLWMGPLALSQLHVVDSFLTVLSNFVLWTVCGLSLRRLIKAKTSAAVLGRLGR